MAERVKVVNKNLIKIMTKEEVNKELISKGDWEIHYYVPGRQFYPYFITINKEKYRFNSLEEIEKVCKTFDKKTLESMTRLDINNEIWKLHIAK